eukprot:s21_g12.t1
MYFDDAHITSWKSEGPSAQWAFSQLNVLLGTPFAEDKRQACASSGTFLGLDYNFETVNTMNSVTFWARERLQEKVSNMLDDAEFHQRLSPAQASKLYGVLNFLENGMFGRVGCGGLQAIKHHQYGRSYRLSPELKQSFALIRTVLACQPKRQFWLTHKRWSRAVAASDAALDIPREGSGGYLILWGSPTERPREAFVALIPDELYDWFTPGTQKIAQLEMLMIAHALVKRAQMFRHRRGYWFIDNVASLMCLVRGRSDSADLERISHFIHIARQYASGEIFGEQALHAGGPRQSSVSTIDAVKVLMLSREDRNQNRFWICFYGFMREFERKLGKWSNLKAAADAADPRRFISPPVSNVEPSKPVAMAPKFDPNEVKVVFLRQYGGEQAPSSVLAPKVGPLGMSPKKVGDDIVKGTSQNRQAKVDVEPNATSLIIKALKEPLREPRLIQATNSAGPRQPRLEPARGVLGFQLKDRKKTKNIKHSGNLTKNVFLDICRQMRKKSLAKEFKGTAKEILGTCFAVGCTVDGQKPGALQQAIDEDEWELPTECISPAPSVKRVVVKRAMAPKFDPNEVKVVFLRQYGGEQAPSSVLAPKVGPLGMSPKKVGDDIVKGTSQWKGIRVTVKLTIQTPGLKPGLPRHLPPDEKEELGQGWSEFKGTAKEILGTCFAVGCTVDGQKPGALQQAIDEDEWELPTEPPPTTAEDTRGPRGSLGGEEPNPFNPTRWFAVYRPCSSDSIRKMYGKVGVGKGLNVKGKSAKKNRLSGFVPFIQISDNKHKNDVEDAPKDARTKIFFRSRIVTARGEFTVSGGNG